MTQRSTQMTSKPHLQPIKKPAFLKAEEMFETERPKTSPQTEHKLRAEAAAAVKPPKAEILKEAEPVKAEAVMPEKTLENSIHDALANLSVEVSGGEPGPHHKLLTNNGIKAIIDRLKEHHLGIQRSY